MDPDKNRFVPLETLPALADLQKPGPTIKQMRRSVINTRAVGRRCSNCDHASPRPSKDHKLKGADANCKALQLRIMDVHRTNCPYWKCAFSARRIGMEDLKKKNTGGEDGNESGRESV